MSVSVGFISLGCSKNLVDSQVMAGYLKAGAITLAPSPETADVILVNTCAFIESAREEAADAILRACAHKERGGCRAVIVAGCMVQRYRGRLKAAFPGVDAFLGIDELERIGEVAGRVAAGKRCGVIAARGMPVKCYNPSYPTLLFTGGPIAYLKIAEGCDHRCAYCAIPNIRGAYRSRSEDALAHEAQAMVRAGVREINLISQDSLRYGADRGGNSAIVPLIRRLDRIRGDFRIRLLYGYPAGVTEEVLHVLNTSRHVCRYLDLPVQHSHPEILRAMRRGKAVASTQDLAARLRQAVPDVVLRTTCLVGFPGETAAHFEHLMEYVERSAFDHLGVFAFSPEEGTPAAAMGGAPSREETEERCARLMALQRRIVRRRARALMGREDTVLLLRRAKTGWVGRLPRQAPEVDGETRVKGVAETARVGDFVRVTVTGGRGYDLEAEAV
ncbi:MAG: 30S ribosomal protein S12 methylthiotransferase RimO [Kiritimatiellia bacterium]|jgi:ribosomal protein S12 methylthiotransferase|nr:30S ribosomal protein S12 methylthiotransferase RimO [Kiritimatiellia bacterium]